MSDVFIVDLFYFHINKNITIFCASNQHFTGMPKYITHDIEYSASILHIQHK